MRVILLLAFVVFSNGAKLNKSYLPPSHAQTSGGTDGLLETPRSGSGQHQNGFGSYHQSINNLENNYNGLVGGDFAYQRPERPQAVFERNAAIIRQDNVNDGEKYAYSYETQNGIYAEESGSATNGVRALGGFSYIGDDGRQYSIRYTADENGFQPQGDHIPTPPPIPAAILKALEQNARDEAAGIFDDGSYREDIYGGGWSSNGYGDVAFGTQNTFESARSRTYLPAKN